MEKFKTLYDKLNKEQKQAVDIIQGPVIVNAGPGTGKTQILSLRIANILKKTDTDPENILALTFTNAGVVSMRDRLSSIIGSSAYNIEINTFHGFCNNIIKEHPEHFPEYGEFSNIDDITKLKIIKNILNTIKLKEINKNIDAKSIAGIISKLKQENISYQNLRDIAENAKKELKKEDYYYVRPKAGQENTVKQEYYNDLSKIDRNIELSYIYEEYENALGENHYYDYNDMILLVLKKMKENENFLFDLREKYLYILVDEFQDTNLSQYEVLTTLASFDDFPNLFVVGDTKQAIYRFQGASNYNFINFKERYPRAVSIDLINNYRSTQQILDSAFSLIQKDKELKSNQEKGKKIQVVKNINQKLEAYFVAKKIQELKTDLNNIAVLYRSHKDSFELINILQKLNIPFNVKDKNGIFGDLDIEKFIILLKTIEDYGNDKYLVNAMHIDFLNLNEIDVYKFIDKYSTDHVNQNLYDVDYSDIKMKDKKSFDNFFENLAIWNKKSKNIPINEFITHIINESGFYTHLFKSKEVLNKLNKLSALIDYIKEKIQIDKKYSLKDFLSDIDIAKQEGIDWKVEAVESNGVNLMTAHGAKGLEFDYVFILAANPCYWEDKRAYNAISLLEEVIKGDDKEEKINDERRLFYVALTRARKNVYISYLKSRDEKPLNPSRFITEIKEELKEETEIDNKKEYDNEGLDFKIIEKPKDILNKDLIKQKFLEKGLSPTSLNNYLKCPWSFFYKNLFRIPEFKNSSLCKGTAMHTAIQKAYEEYARNGNITEEFLIQEFKKAINKEPILKEEYEKIKEESIESLKKYFKENFNEFKNPGLNEYKIKDVFIDDIPITGKLDRINFIQDTKKVDVIDFKTGTPKSEKDVLGINKSSTGNYYNQLVFYALLLKYHHNQKYIFNNGIIDFVEPKKNGKFVKHTFSDINNTKIDELEDLIKKISKEILELKFWDQYCDDPDCFYCKLRKMLD